MRIYLPYNKRSLQKYTFIYLMKRSLEFGALCDYEKYFFLSVLQLHEYKISDHHNPKNSHIRARLDFQYRGILHMRLHISNIIL